MTKSFAQEANRSGGSLGLPLGSQREPTKLRENREADAETLGSLVSARGYAGLSSL